MPLQKTLLPLLLLAAAASAEPAQLPISYICLEARSGIILAESHADVVRPPASMIKLMMMHMVSEGLRQGLWDLDTPITASAKAERMGGTQVYLKAGETHTLGHLMNAVAVASANDASMAVAEGLWGSEDAYKRAMNERARELGMFNSEFHSVHGLPPDPGEEFDQTTARDMAVLARLCVQDPTVMAWAGQRTLAFRPGKGEKSNTNKLLWRMEDCDGLKTGYIRAAGFCISATAERDGIRVISVVMGHPNKYQRFNLAEQLMEEAFEELDHYVMVAKGESVEAKVRVPNAQVEDLSLVAAEDLVVPCRSRDRSHLKLVAKQPAVLRAPLRAGDPLGVAEIRLQGRVLAKVDLVAPYDVAPAGWAAKMERSVLRLN
jgi:D-alanyl-D-alanine carboxypeptidase (penicillin-binding protein 5/6)